jgi:transposase
MCGLYHRAAELLTPIYRCILGELSQERVVQADETPLKMHGDGSGKSRPGFMWTFLDAEQIAYVYSPGRSGDVPVAVLGGTSGVLVVDAYSGYNAVCAPASRVRAGCLAHIRRKFFEARNSAETAADEAMALILEVYRVEAKARKQGVLRTEAHRQLRQTEGRAAMDRFHTWLTQQSQRWPPKGPMGKAIAYALNQWDTLCVFLDNELVPPDNNLSENALRVIALGRKNWQLVGHEEAGQNTAVLHTLVACCTLAGINPQMYLADVLIRVQTHPASDIAALLPKRWLAARETPRPIVGCPPPTMEHTQSGPKL